MSEERDEATIQRQQHCRHAFIKRQTDPERCVHCGVSMVDWDAMQVKQATAYPWGGIGGTP